LPFFKAGIDFLLKKVFSSRRFRLSREKSGGAVFRVFPVPEKKKKQFFFSFEFAFIYMENYNSPQREFLSSESF